MIGNRWYGGGALGKVQGFLEHRGATGQEWSWASRGPTRGLNGGWGVDRGGFQGWRCLGWAREHFAAEWRSRSCGNGLKVVEKWIHLGKVGTKDVGATYGRGDFEGTEKCGCG